MYGNPYLSKLCRENPIRNGFGWYKMSFMVYFEFWLSWFWFGRKFLVKMAKFCHFYFLLDTPTPMCRSARLGVELRLSGGPYAKANPSPEFLHFLFRLGVVVLRLGEPLRLGVALLCLGVPASPILVPLFR